MGRPVLTLGITKDKTEFPVLLWEHNHNLNVCQGQMSGRRKHVIMFIVV